MQHDVVGDLELLAVMIARTVHEQQDELAGVLLGQCGQENLEAFRIGRRHDQIDASSVLRADGAIEVDVFANELGGNPRPDADGSPARSWAVHPPKACFIGEHDAQATTPSGGSPTSLPHSIWKIFFLKAS